MTVQIKSFLKEKELPPFLKKDLLLFDKVDKVFPSIGLPNCQEDIAFDNSKFVRASAEILFCSIENILYSLKHKLNALPLTKENTYVLNIINILYDRMGFFDQFISINNGSISLKIPMDIGDNNILSFKKNESLFKVYNKIYQKLYEFKIKIPKLDSIPEFKIYSADNLPNNKFKIVFSSDGIDGLWDIATMSMRGIKSCQSWHGQYKRNLVGSIVDPFTAIIYVTSGNKFNEFGSKMIRRSVVRFVINSLTKKPFIIIDRVYPSSDDEIYSKFLNFIKSKVPNDMPVYFGFDTNINSSYIPKNKIHDKLNKYTLPYRDTGILFKSEIKEKPSIFDKNLLSKKTKFRNILKNTAYNSYLYILKDQSLQNKNIKKSVDFILNSEDFKFLIKDLYKEIANNVIKNITYDGILSSKEYMRKLCYYYMNHKNHVMKKLNASFVKEINHYYKDYIPAKINNKIITNILSPIQKIVDLKIKTELMSLLDKKIVTIQLPD